MANRTLRRSYTGTIPNAEPDTESDGRDTGIEQDASGTVADDDSATVNDGTDSERDTERVSGGVGVVEIDPSELTEYIERDSNGNGDSGEPRKRRGRKPGTKNRTGSKKAADSVKPFLMMAHTWAAVFLKTPELELAESEAEQLNAAYANFCEYHEIPIFTAKRMSEINMVAALLLVYGPRFVAVRARHKEERKEAQAKKVISIN
jgi:hypothetical protein